MRIVIIVLVLLAGVSITTDVFAQAACTHYASPTGGGNGSQSSPFSINSFWAVAKPGLVLCLVNGNYTALDSDQSIIKTTVSGAAGNPITIRAQNDGGVFLNGSAKLQPVTIGSNFITMEGIDACCSPWGVIGFYPGTHDITFRRMVAWDAGVNCETVVGGAQCGDVEPWHLVYGYNILVEDAAGFGRGRGALLFFGNDGSHTPTPAPAGTFKTVRRFWGMYEISQTATNPRKMAFIGYSDKGDILENAIGSWNSRPGDATTNAYGVFAWGGEGVNDKLLGSISYLRSGDNVHPSYGVHTFEHAGQYGWSTYGTLIENVVTWTNIGGLQGFGLDNVCSNCTARNNTTIGGSGSGFGSWAQSNNVTATSNANLVALNSNIWDGTSTGGARVCYQYQDGKLTKTPLWPWPMDARIKAAMGRVGLNPANYFQGTDFTGASNTVTSQMETLFGTIPVACRSGAPQPTTPTITITSPTSSPTFPITTATVTLGGTLGTGTGTNTRLGLHVTSDELAAWKTRASKGPYRVAGDVSTNSPGDWTRISASALAFKNGTHPQTYAGQTTNTCVTPGSSPSGILNNFNLNRSIMDAAFYYLVTGDTTYSTPVRQDLLAQAALAGTDFSNKSRWCEASPYGPLTDENPLMEVTSWLTRLLFAYDYTKDTFSAAQQTTMNTWFLNAANHFMGRADAWITTVRYPDRMSDNYTTPTSLGVGSGITVTHAGGFNVDGWHQGWSNRLLTAVRFATLVGVMQNNATLKTKGQRFFKEFINYFTFSDGTIAEQYRWSDGTPILGWEYAMFVVGELITIADAFARVGDMSLYNYSSSAGFDGTAGGSKSLSQIMNLYARYVNHDTIRYSGGQNGNANYIIDTDAMALSGLNDADDHYLVQGNLYYQSAYVKSIYMRTAPNAPAYGSYNSTGGWPPFTMQWGIMPGPMFMFGQLEGQVNPFP